MQYRYFSGEGEGDYHGSWRDALDAFRGIHALGAAVMDENGVETTALRVRPVLARFSLECVEHALAWAGGPALLRREADEWISNLKAGITQPKPAHMPSNESMFLFDVFAVGRTMELQGMSPESVTRFSDPYKAIAICANGEGSTGLVPHMMLDCAPDADAERKWQSARLDTLMGWFFAEQE